MLLGAACHDVTPPTAKAAVLTFTFDTSPLPRSQWETMRVFVTNPATVLRAWQYLRNPSVPVFPLGKIVRGPGVDPRYPFHYLPETVVLTEGAAVGCDWPLMHTPHDVNSFMRAVAGDSLAPEATWCPGYARVSAIEYSGP